MDLQVFVMDDWNLDENKIRCIPHSSILWGNMLWVIQMWMEKHLVKDNICNFANL